MPHDRKPPAAPAKDFASLTPQERDHLFSASLGYTPKTSDYKQSQAHIARLSAEVLAAVAAGRREFQRLRKLFYKGKLPTTIKTSDCQRMESDFLARGGEIKKCPPGNARGVEDWSPFYWGRVNGSLANAYKRLERMRAYAERDAEFLRDLADFAADVERVHGATREGTGKLEHFSEEW